MKKLQSVAMLVVILVAIGGCTFTLKTIDRGANIDIETMKAGRVTNPKYIEAWPTFSGYFKGFLGPERETLLPASVLKAWGELDATAARYAKGEKLTDEEMSKFFGTKFGRVLIPTTQAILKARVPPVAWTWLENLVGLR